jgi:hypothetical protein
MTMETMPWKYTDSGSRTPYPRHGYTIDTWANGYGIWHAQAIFGSGLGNTGEAERIKHNALAQCKRRIREELKARQGQPLARLRYEISDNYVDPQNLMWSITVREK